MIVDGSCACKVAWYDADHSEVLLYHTEACFRSRMQPLLDDALAHIEALLLNASWANGKVESAAQEFVNQFKSKEPAL